jgi:hypothetical protein
MAVSAVIAVIYLPGVELEENGASVFLWEVAARLRLALLIAQERNLLKSEWDRMRVRLILDKVHGLMPLQFRYRVWQEAYFSGLKGGNRPAWYMVDNGDYSTRPRQSA